MRSLLLFALLAAPVLAQSQPAGQLSPWWRERAPGAQRYTADAKKLPLITVQGNHFVAALQQALGNMTSDESGRAGYENFHSPGT